MKILLSLILIFNVCGAGEVDSSSIRPVFAFNPSLDRMSFDASTMVLLTTFSLTADLRVIEMVRSSPMQIGARVALHRMTKLTGGGEESLTIHYFPLLDALLLTTFPVKQVKGHIYAGLGYYNFGSTDEFKNGSLFKFGIEFEWILLSPFSAITLRVESTRGSGLIFLGLSVGYFSP